MRNNGWETTNDTEEPPEGVEVLEVDSPNLDNSRNLEGIKLTEVERIFKEVLWELATETIMEQCATRGQREGETKEQRDEINTAEVAGIRS